MSSGPAPRACAIAARSSASALIAAFVAMAAPSSFVAPRDPLAQDLSRRLEPPSAEHPFGTDDFGRDMLSRVLHGARMSLRVGLVAVAMALLVGGTHRLDRGLLRRRVRSAR